MCKFYKSLKTVNLTGTGRFSVKRAFQHFKQCLNSNPERKKLYVNFLNEYAMKGRM